MRNEGTITSWNDELERHYRILVRGVGMVSMRCHQLEVATVLRRRPAVMSR